MVYVSPSLSHYLVSELTAKWYGHGDAIPHTKFSYYDKNQSIIFTKEFDLYGTALISYSGKYVILEMSGEIDEITLILNQAGSVLRRIDEYEKLVRISNESFHRTILLTYRYFDKSIKHPAIISVLTEGGIYDIPFHGENAQCMNFSYGEKYFTVFSNDSIHVFDNTGKFYWKIKKDNSRKKHLMLFPDGDRYMIWRTNSDTLVEIRDFNSHALLNTIMMSGKYHAIDKKFYRIGFVSDTAGDFWLSGHTGGKRYFYFFDRSGNFIHETNIPLRSMEYIFKFKLEDNEYKVNVRK